MFIGGNVGDRLSGGVLGGVKFRKKNLIIGTMSWWGFG